MPAKKELNNIFLILDQGKSFRITIVFWKNVFAWFIDTEVNTELVDKYCAIVKPIAVPAESRAVQILTVNNDTKQL